MNETAKKLLPVAFGIAATVALLVLVAYLANKRKTRVSDVPQLTITSPAPGAQVDSPLVVEFHVPGGVQLLPTGWARNHLHLHALLDGVEHMPAAADIRALTDSTFAWTIPAAARGEGQSLWLVWANTHHGPIVDGSSRKVPITVR